MAFDSSSHEDTDAAGNRRVVSTWPAMLPAITDATDEHTVHGRLRGAYRDIEAIRRFLLRRHPCCIVCGRELGAGFFASIVSTATGARLAHTEKCFVQASMRDDDFLVTMKAKGIATLREMITAEQEASAPPIATPEVGA